MKTYKILNVKCEKCVKTLKSKLLEDFGEIDVNLEVQPNELTIHKDEFDEDKLKNSLKGMGYPVEGDKNCLITKVKSYISCMVGKFKK